ncbi:unnamed protein product [Soboliphyme baturini]|uniref:Uncharacterized protein n=1 Tax=Soboliphyme baturini TaxID=241478 RepID=A0A183IS02_9BILA|nr:unnamed protein product [Soboliphyme baturini]
MAVVVEEEAGVGEHLQQQQPKCYKRNTLLRGFNSGMQRSAAAAAAKTMAHTHEEKGLEDDSPGLFDHLISGVQVEVSKNEEEKQSSTRAV